MKRESKQLQLIREKLRQREYEFAIPHFFEEMANDDLNFADIEHAIQHGQISRVFTDDPRGPRYEIVGEAADGRTIAVVCRVKDTGRLLLITTWEIYE
ncbi:MAG: DUF4258 domain-containing protein [Acidobacteria bacterium]|nr:DUF4258 domain-containing protein [Acidobacteriota bacterium]